MSGVYFVINGYECWINDSRTAQKDAQLVSTSLGNLEFCIIKTNSENHDFIKSADWKPKDLWSLY